MNLYTHTVVAKNLIHVNHGFFLQNSSPGDTVDQTEDAADAADADAAREGVKS